MRGQGLLIFLSAVAAGSGPAPFGESVGSPITEDQAPHMKAGLWRQSQQVTSGGLREIEGPRTTQKVCYADRSLAPAKHGVCKRFALGRTADGAFVMDSECSLEGTVSRVRFEARGDFAASYSSTGWVEFSRPGELVKSRITAREQFDYLGPCPAGMKPHP